MRIAFIGGRLSRRASGVKIVVERLSAALTRNGQNVAVFGLSDREWRAGDSTAWSGAPASVFQAYKENPLGYAAKLGPAVQRFQPDIIHTHGIWMYGSAVASRLSKRGLATLVSPHGMLDPWALAQSHIKKRFAGALFEHRHLKQASAIHALNKDEEQAIRDYGLKAPVAILPNGVDIPDPTDAPMRPAWRETLPTRARILLYLGRLHSKKNLAPLIEAFARCDNKAWHLVIAGPDQHGEQLPLAVLAAKGPTAARIHFVGPQFDGEKRASLAAADAFILPSLSEGLPMAVLEAWAARLPVLMSRACNLPEGFVEGAAIDSGTTVGSITTALSTLFTLSPHETTAIADAGYRLVKRNYSWDKIAEQFVELYEYCLSHNSMRQPAFMWPPVLGGR